jgi:hypothetical protein
MSAFGDAPELGAWVSVTFEGAGVLEGMVTHQAIDADGVAYVLVSEDGETAHRVDWASEGVVVETR